MLAWYYFSLSDDITFSARTCAELDQEFNEKLGHSYYVESTSDNTTAPALSIEACLDHIKSEVDFEDVYKINIFDCSEMSAYVEYYFENVGYDADILRGEAGTFGLRHAWVTVNRDGGITMIEPTSLTVITGTDAGQYYANDTFEDIYALEADNPQGLNEWDWWNSKYGGRLAELPFGSS